MIWVLNIKRAALFKGLKSCALSCEMLPVIIQVPVNAVGDHPPLIITYVAYACVLASSPAACTAWHNSLSPVMLLTSFHLCMPYGSDVLAWSHSNSTLTYSWKTQNIVWVSTLSLAWHTMHAPFLIICKGWNHKFSSSTALKSNFEMLVLYIRTLFFMLFYTYKAGQYINILIL